MTASRAEPTLSAAEAREAIAAMAEHLGRGGVGWLPRPREAGVSMLRERCRLRLSPSPAAAATSSPSPPPREASPGVPVPGRPTAPSLPPSSPPPTRPGARDSAGGAGSATSRAAASAHAASAGGRLGRVAALTVAEGPYPGDPLPLAGRESALAQMSREVAGCTRCDALVGCRKRTVFGEGHPSPRVVFFGEAPGADEDRQGRPFVGKAGGLLTKMIEACSFRREDVYILNTVKCRPPGNRNPDPTEIANCRPFFERQLLLLRPEYIVCLGAVSSQALLQSTLSVGRLRGSLHRYFDSKVVVTYHPAYLLRNPAAKKAAWEDLQLMLRDAGIQPRRP